MTELLSELFKAQPDVLLMLAGLVLIGIGVVGSIKTYIDPGKYGRIAALGIGAILLTIGVTLHARELTDLAKAAINPVKSTEMSSICTFDTGPLAGNTNLLPETQIGSVGGACKDTAGNSGILVGPNTPVTSAHGHTQKAGPHEVSTASAQPVLIAASAPIPAGPKVADTALSNVCLFKEGAHAGVTAVVAQPTALPVGSPCHSDELKSTGFLVAPNSSPTLLSTLCTFNQGPNSGSTENIRHTKPLLPGTACRDSIGNSGLIALAGSPITPMSPETSQLLAAQSSTCHATSGPRAGTTFVYGGNFPEHGPVGAPCHRDKQVIGVLIQEN
ncbi:hypothetical protein [Granulicella arctica]|uniref:hypothetical protein n=1 Tax=Granulicella arctica TaxID=940613 RepID=UPI0021E0F6CF|nr:hypothetical protein [Granulicella arctica]